MGIEFFLYLAAGALAGGFINGLAGFGTGLFALGFWLQILPPEQAVPIVCISAVVPGLHGVWAVRKEIVDQPRRLSRFLVPGLLGVPLGVAALSIVNPDHLKVAIGLMLVFYGGYFSFKHSLPKIERSKPIVDISVGLLGGVLGGLASLSGPAPAIWCSLQSWTKSESRAVMQSFNVVILGASAVLFFIKGLYTFELLKLIAIALPLSMVASLLGLSLFRRLSTDRFRRLTIMMMLVSGVALLIRQWL
jgi:uncharacterized membrane protein YfcA